MTPKDRGMLNGKLAAVQWLDGDDAPVAMSNAREDVIACVNQLLAQARAEAFEEARLHEKCSDTIATLERDLTACRAALREFIDLQTTRAKLSFSEWSNDRVVWNDEIWDEADPETFALIVTARALVGQEGER